MGSPNDLDDVPDGGVEDGCFWIQFETIITFIAIQKRTGRRDRGVW